MKSLIIPIIISFLNVPLVAQNSWYSVNTPSGSNHYFVYFINANTGFTSTDTTFWMSTNGGPSWFMTFQSVGGLYSFLNSSTGYTIGLSGTSRYFYKTTNAGLNWDLRGQQSNLYCGDLVFLDEITGFVGFFNIPVYPWNIIYRTTDGGYNWTPCSHDLGLIEEWLVGTYAMSFANATTGIAVGKYGNIYIGGFYRNGFVLITQNGGANWVSPGLSYFLDHPLHSAKFVNPGTLFFGGDSSLYKSTNYGENWTPLTYIPLCKKYCFINDSISYAFTNNYIYKTRNGGYNWYVQDTTSSGITGICFVNATTGWVSTGNDILKTINGGDPYHSISGQIRFQDNLQPVNSGCVKALKIDRLTQEIITIDSTNIQSNGYYSLYHIPQDSLYIMAFENDEAQLVFVPTYYPSSTSWQNATVLYPTGNLTNINVLVYRINNNGGPYHIGGTTYLNTQNPLTGLGGVIVYAKIGGDYKAYSISDAFGHYQIDSLTSGTYNLIVDRIGFASLSKIVLITNFSKDTINFYFNLTGIIRKEQKIPDNYWLGFNYPNPFNSTTRIAFGLPIASNTKLIIYDILGREVITLMDEKLQAGNYDIEWDAGNFSSGVYFYRIVSGDFTQSKKIVLIK